MALKSGWFFTMMAKGLESYSRGSGLFGFHHCPLASPQIPFFGKVSIEDLRISRADVLVSELYIFTYIYILQ